MPKDVRVTVNQKVATRTVAEIQKALKGRKIHSVVSTASRLTLVTTSREEIHIEWDSGPVLAGVDYVITTPLDDADIDTVSASVAGR